MFCQYDRRVYGMCESCHVKGVPKRGELTLAAIFSFAILQNGTSSAEILGQGNFNFDQFILFLTSLILALFKG